MVRRETTNGRDHRFEIRPHRSLTRGEARWCFVSIASFTLSVATAFTVAGFWLVLPFAGLEVAVLAVAMWLCARSGREVEIVRVGPSTVSVDKGRDTPARVWEGPRAWVRVRLQRARARMHPSRLVLRTHGREVQIGAFLPEDERRRLAAQLRDAMVAAGDVRGVRPGWAC